MRIFCLCVSKRISEMDYSKVVKKLVKVGENSGLDLTILTTEVTSACVSSDGKMTKNKQMGHLNVSKMSIILILEISRCC